MLVRCYYPQCNFRNTTPIDSFWVEATYEEAEKAIFPFLTPEEIKKSKTYAEMGQKIAAKISSPPKPYCFLVAKDLSIINPFEVHYPFSNMWNAYSPFKSLSECYIDTLEELKKLENKMNYNRLEYIKNVNNVNNPEQWAYDEQDSGENRLLIGDKFRLNFRTNITTADTVKNHALKLPQGSLIILSQNPLGKKRFLTHIVELINEGSKDKSEWEESDQWGIFRWVKVHWIADFDHPNSIPLDKDVMKANWSFQGTKAKRLESPSLMFEWKNINNLRTHLQTVFN
jgi:hypothetical protein